MYFEDLSTYAYHEGVFYRPVTLNVGWLSLGRSFDQVEPSELVLDKIWEFCRVSVAQMRGIHQCEFCDEDPSFVTRGAGRLLLGSAEIRVFARDGTIFAAPNLIYHYMSIHHYRPPDDFLTALADGSGPSSEGYFARLASLDLAWNPTSSPETKPARLRLLP